MARDSATTVITPDDNGGQISSGGVRRAGYALMVSGLVHAVIVVALSLIALGVASDANPVITMFFTGDEGKATDGEFEVLPDISIDPPVETSVVPAATASVSELAEPPPHLPESIFSHAAASATPTDTAGTGTADAAAVSSIQGRVKNAGGRRGEVQFALAWKNTNDVDLHVIAPSGERISYGHKRSRCQGALDVDMNVDGESEEPVENVRWLSRKAPSGRYTVIINLFRIHDRGSGRTDYQLLAQLGPKTELISHVASLNRGVMVHRFMYVPHSVQGHRRELMLERFNRMQADEERRASKLLERAKTQSGNTREKTLQEIAGTYPHTDAAIEALKMMSGVTTKT